MDRCTCTVRNRSATFCTGRLTVKACVFNTIRCLTLPTNSNISTDLKKTEEILKVLFWLIILKTLLQIILREQRMLIFTKLIFFFIFSGPSRKENPLSITVVFFTHTGNSAISTFTILFSSALRWLYLQSSCI